VRALRDLSLEGFKQRPAAAEQELDGGEVVCERRLRAGVSKAHRAQPCHVRGRPGARRPRIALPAAQQELPEAVPGAHQVGPDVVDAADHVPELLVLHGRYQRERQLAGG
jgi:hypothetical protein